jgi:proteasome activator subunit 4
LVNSGYYIDKIRTGFLAWTPSVKAYKVVGQTSGLSWEASSQQCLRVIAENVTRNDYFKRLSLLWSQESSKTSGRIELRSENMAYIKSLGPNYHIDVRYTLILSFAVKMLEQEGLDDILAAIDPLLSDSDKFKQRGGAEILGGVLRGP